MGQRLHWKVAGCFCTRLDESPEAPPGNPGPLASPSILSLSISGTGGADTRRFNLLEDDATDEIEPGVLAPERMTGASEGEREFRRS